MDGEVTKEQLDGNKFGNYVEQVLPWQRDSTATVYNSHVYGSRRSQRLSQTDPELSSQMPFSSN